MHTLSLSLTHTHHTHHTYTHTHTHTHTRRGHFARVHLCLDKTTGRKHAVKIFNKHDLRDDSTVKLGVCVYVCVCVCVCVTCVCE